MLHNLCNKKECIKALPKIYYEQSIYKVHKLQGNPCHYSHLFSIRIINNFLKGINKKITHFDDLKNIAQPSTYFLSFSDIVFARDFGEKIPSKPSLANSGLKKL